MSIRAYKIIEIKKEENNTFNLWHDEELVEAIHLYGKDQLNIDGCGIVEFDTEELKHSLKFHKWQDKDQKDKLKQMIQQSKDDGGFVSYYCY